MSAIAPNPKIVATAIPLGQHIMLRSFGEGAIQTEAPIGNQLPGRPLAPKFRNFNTWRGRTTIETAGQTEVRIRQLRPPLCPSIIDETPVSCAPADRHSRPILRNLIVREGIFEMSSASNPQSDADHLEAAADQAIAACGGDAREAEGADPR